MSVTDAASTTTTAARALCAWRRVTQREILLRRFILLYARSAFLRAELCTVSVRFLSDFRQAFAFFFCP
jgi:hypothetical protein